MKKHLILIFLIIVWIFLFIVNFAKAAESPVLQVPIPPEIASDSVKSYAYEKVARIFGTEHWESFNNIIERESQWDPTNKNPHSTAYGLGQFLDSTWKGTGYIKTADPQIQIDATIVYIMDRYEDPVKGWVFWKQHLWY